MSLFDKYLQDSESLFKDEIALDFDYMPAKIEHRENENDEIAKCIAPLFNKRNGRNLIITGSPGIGKTVAAKLVLEEVRKQTDEVITLYVNCWRKETTHKVLLDICDQLSYRFTQNKNTSQLINNIAEILNKRSAVIVLDEVDKLVDSQVIYYFLEEINRRTLILITNNKEFLSALDARIRSRLTPEVLDFRHYNFDETHSILKKRSEYAFVPNVFLEDELKNISEQTFELKDIRLGLSLMKEAGEIAERKLKRKIEKEDVDAAISKISEFKMKSDSDLSEDELKLLEIVKNNSGKSLKEINSLYDPSISGKTVLRKIKNLEKANLVTVKLENSGELRRNLIFFVKS